MCAYEAYDAYLHVARSPANIAAELDHATTQSAGSA